MSSERHRAIRWLIVGVVLVAACVVALWPRGANQDTSDQDQASTSTPTFIPPTDTPSPANTNARLPSCPQGQHAQGPLRDVHVRCLAGNAPFDLGAALTGRTTVLNVWASWCQPCRQELPTLAAYARRPDTAHVLLLQVQSAPSDGRALLDQLGVRLPAAHDDGAADKALRVPFGLPASYVVTPDGRPHLVTNPRVFTSPDAVAGAVARYGSR